MRFLCNYDFVGNCIDLDYILNSIPLVFKNYYLTVGPEKIKNLQYKNSVILEEYNRLKGNQNNVDNLRYLIYSSFVVGEKYTKPYIKQTLTTIYNKLGVQSSPKAVDIENYFDIKLVDVIDETGKRTKGFKLINKKGGE